MQIKATVETAEDEAFPDKLPPSARNLAGLEPDGVKEKYPTFRFTEEVILMLNILCNAIRRVKSVIPEHDAPQQILGLVFERALTKIKEKRHLYLYPHLGKVKMVGFLEENLTVTHKVNFENAFDTFIAYFTGQPAFPDAGADAAHIVGLNKALVTLRQDYHMNIFKKMLGNGREISSVFSYKNFEHQLIHSLDAEDCKVVISRKLLAELLKGMIKHKGKMSLQDTETNDPLHKILAGLEAEKGLIAEIEKSNTSSGSYDDCIQLKLHTRLLVNYEFREGRKYAMQVEEKLGQYCRCLKCNAVLTTEMAVQSYDENIVLSAYEPADRQAPATLFAEILREVDTHPSTDKTANIRKDAQAEK